MKYTKIKILGYGSFSSVYQVKCAKTEKYYALKRLSRNNFESYENEIITLMKLSHPNIVPIIDYFKEKRHLNIILPFAKLGTLCNLITKRNKIKKIFTFEDIKFITISISSGINYLHNNEIIHCDIKPSNILLFGNKVIKICDFGVSKKFKASYYKTVVGTPYYIAPEIINNLGYNNSIDYWSLGVLVYELITFKKPFDANSYYQLMIQIVRNNYNLDIIPIKYSKLILNLLNENFNRRYKHLDIVNYFNNVIHLPPLKLNRDCNLSYTC